MKSVMNISFLKTNILGSTIMVAILGVHKFINLNHVINVEC